MVDIEEERQPVSSSRRGPCIKVTTGHQMRPDNLSDTADAQQPQLQQGEQSCPLLMHKGSIMFAAHFCVLAAGHEATYIYVDLQQAGDISMLTAGSTVTIQVWANFTKIWRYRCIVGKLMILQSLDTVAPSLRLPDGSMLQGKYSETIGSFVFFDQPKATQTGCLSTTSTGQSQNSAQYVCCTEKQLTMRPAVTH